MDYTPKQVTNGYFELRFNNERLDNAFTGNCYRYDYILGDNELTISLLEYENSRFLELFKMFRERHITITLDVLKPSARNRNTQGMQKYYTMDFHGAVMKRYTNNGNVERVSYSNVKIIFEFSDYDVEYH
ncbi:hypothetical protein ACQZV8_00735 [Magnetococcales bacterium HHB-1]